MSKNNPFGYQEYSNYTSIVGLMVIFVFGITEPGAGSDLQAIKTTAKKDGNQYTLNGSKIFITNGGSADLIIVAAKTDQSAGAKGISLILLDTKILSKGSFLTFFHPETKSQPSSIFEIRFCV